MAKIRDDLVGSVLVENPNGGDLIVLVAGSKVPKGVELGAHVLAPKGSGASGEASTPTGDGSGASESDAGSGGGSDDLVVPPMNGAGSGAGAWREYGIAAAAKAGLQIDIPEDAKRGDIVDALKSANIPVE